MFEQRLCHHGNNRTNTNMNMNTNTNTNMKTTNATNIIHIHTRQAHLLILHKRMQLISLTSESENGGS